MGHKPPLTYDFAKERIMLVLKLYDKVDPEKVNNSSIENYFLKIGNFNLNFNYSLLGIHIFIRTWD